MRPRDEALNETEVIERRDAALLRALSTPHKRQKEMKLGPSLAEAATQAILGAVPLGEKWLRDDFGPSLLFGKLGKRVCVVRNIFRKAERTELLRFNLNDDDFPAADRPSLIAGIRKALEPFLVSRGDLRLEDLPEGFIIATVDIGQRQ
jgi:hypothetical protein